MKILDSWQYTIFTTIISFYALFADDIRIIFCAESVDDVFYSFATIVLTFYTMAKSKGLSDFLDAVSDERLTAWQKLKALAGVWRRGED